MKTDFLEAQIATAKARFNQTFGRQVTCDLFTRQQVILSILHMERLLRKISTPAGSRTETKSCIRRLIKTRDTLASIYDTIEKSQKRKEVHTHEKPFPPRGQYRNHRTRNTGR